MESKEIKCKTLMSKSKGGYDFTINPYVGCTHGCVYCYAPYFLREKREWGSFVDVKANAPEVLEKETKKNQKGSILLSIVTDPYQEIEKEKKLTRKVLEKLSKNYKVSILTKSDLVLRDIDIFRRINAEVGMTITTLNDADAKNFEPNAPPPMKRLDVLSYLKVSGVRTYIFFGPMLPFISDADLEKTVSKFALARPDKVMVDRLNIKGPNHWNKLKAFLDKNYPGMTDRWREVLFSHHSTYYEDLRKALIELFNKYGLKYEFCY
jgi:DNA repair photolyase